MTPNPSLSERTCSSGMLGHIARQLRAEASFAPIQVLVPGDAELVRDRRSPVHRRASKIAPEVRSPAESP
jgi:hypothetical protein